MEKDKGPVPDPNKPPSPGITIKRLPRKLNPKYEKDPFLQNYPECLYLECQTLEHFIERIDILKNNNIGLELNEKTLKKYILKDLTNDDVINEQVFRYMRKCGILKKTIKKCLDELKEKKNKAEIRKKISEIPEAHFMMLKGKYLKILEFLEWDTLHHDSMKSELLEWDDTFKNIISTINYDDIMIMNSEGGIFYMDREHNVKEIMSKPIILSYKTNDVRKRANLELFSFNYNGIYYRNKSIKESLSCLKENIQKYGKIGEDIMKKFFNYHAEFLPQKAPIYILGWDDGWYLPFNEEEKNMTIITHSELQEEIYLTTKRNMYEKYDRQNKEMIKDAFNLLVKKAQVDPVKLAITLGWVMAASFRLFFIKKLKLFPLLYLCGKKDTGKSTKGDWLVVNFFKLRDTHFSPAILNSYSQTEDVVASTTFPLNIQEVSIITDKKTIPVLKDLTTGNSPFLRKNQDQSLKANRLKVAPLMLDGNSPASAFKDEAWNSKMIYLRYDHDEKINYDEEWDQVLNFFMDKRPFSLLYDHTKSWTDADLEERLYKVKECFEDECKFLKKEDQRLLKSFKIIMVGLHILNEVYGIQVDVNKIPETLKEARTYITEELYHLFIYFVKECIDLGTTLSKGKDLKNLPFYLKHSLSLAPKTNTYNFTLQHLKDFEKMSGQTFESLSQLYGLLNESLSSNKQLIEYKTAYSKSQGKSAKCIVIDQSLIP